MSDRYVMMAQRVQLFKGLSAEDVAKIFAKGRTQLVSRGDIIFHQGTVGNQMFVVLGGKVSLFDKKKHLADVAAGGMFGEMALISSEPRSATAVAAEDSNLFVLDETTFHRLMTKKAAIQILLNIAGILSERLRKTSAELTKLKERLQDIQQAPGG